MFKKTLFIVIAFIIALFLSAVGALSWAIIHPRTAWDMTEKYFLPSDLTVTWKAMDGDVNFHHWRHWSLNWKVESLEIKKIDPTIDLGIEHAHLKLDVNLFSSRPLVEFEVLEAVARENNRVQIKATKDPAPAKNIHETLTSILEYIEALNRSRKVETLHIQIPELEVSTDETSPPLVLNVQIEKSPQSYQSLQLDLGLVRPPWSAKVKATLDPSQASGPHEFLTADVSAQSPEMKITSKLRALYRKGEFQFLAEPKILLTSNSFSLHPSIELLSQEDQPAQIKAWADVDLLALDKEMRAPLEKACQCRLPKTFRFSLRASAFTEVIFDSNSKKKKALTFSLSLENLKNKLFTAELEARGDVYKEKNNWLLNPQLNSEITVHHFQDFQRLLDAKGILIPASLDVLDGTLHLVAKTPVAEDATHYLTEAQFDIQLKSQLQKVDVTTALSFHLAKDFKSAGVKIKTLIRSLVLELPPLDPVRGLPALTADQRIIYKKPVAKKKKGFVFTVEADVATEKPGAVKLLTAYADPHVPLTIDWRSQGDTIQGSLKMEPFAITYLRRRIEMEQFLVTLKGQDPLKSPLSGRWHVDQGGYRIFIDLSGTLEAPNYAMSSDPYLPKKDILSVLLYGRPSDQLVSGESEAAGSFNAALADRAIGLFGLWAFASTPIQSFSYDATRKVYTATVKLADGLTAGIGTNWEKATNFELRQRLTRRWVITASWLPNEDGSGQESRLVLRWEYRF